MRNFYVLRFTFLNHMIHQTPKFHLLKIYAAHFKVWMALQFQYRVAMLIWLLGLIIQPVIYMVVWANVAEANGGMVNGYSAGDFAAYFIAAMLVNHLAYTWHMWEYDYIIRQGKLSPRLLRPMHPIHADIAENISFKVLTTFVIVPTTIALILLFNPTWNPLPWSLVAFVPAIIMAFLIQFMFGWCVAILAFFTTRVMAIIRLYFLGKFFLGGQMAPLPLLPAGLQTLAKWTPYPWMMYFPVELLLGGLTPEEAANGLVVQLFWVIVSLVCVRLLWRAGVKRYAAFGA